MIPATRLLATITAHFGAIETPAQDPLDAVILRDLRPDSLGRVELIAELEEAFGVEITDDEWLDMPETATLRDLLGLVLGKVGVAA